MREEQDQLVALADEIMVDKEIQPEGHADAEPKAVTQSHGPGALSTSHYTSLLNENEQLRQENMQLKNIILELGSQKMELEVQLQGRTK